MNAEKEREIKDRAEGRSGGSNNQITKTFRYIDSQPICLEMNK